MATTTLTGTTGNDILNAPGSVTTLVAGLEGNDTITLQAAGDSSNAGSGDDTVTLAQAGVASVTVNAGSGNDTIALNTSVTTLNGSLAGNDGNDVITITAAQVVGGVIGGNAGSDTITLSNGVTNAFVGAGKDADRLVVSAGTFTNTTVVGGGGKDTLALDGGTFNLTTIQAADGHDIINASQAVFGTSFLNAGKGYDSINLGAQSTVTVSGGAGNDTVSFGGVFAGGAIYGDGIGVTTGGDLNGADVIGNSAAQFGSTNAISIFGAGGNDTINFLSASTGVAFYADGGDGADVIGGTQSILTFSQTTIGGGLGADTIKLAGIATGAQVLGGAGNDSITFVSPTGVKGSVNGGDGADTITVLSGIGNTVAQSMTINGGAGADRINFAYDVGIQPITNNAFTAATGYLGVVVYSAGDTVALSSTALSATQGNWLGGGGQINVMSSIANLASTFVGAGGVSGISQFGEGGLSVFSDGTDTYFFVNDTTASTTLSFAVLGADLVTVTTFGSINNTTANFGFTVAAAAGTTGAANSTGVAITLL